MRACDKTDCTSGKQGLHEPAMIVWPEGHRPLDSNKAELRLIGLLLCDDCKETSTASEFIDDDFWTNIKIAFYTAGKAQPCRETVKLKWNPPTILEGNLNGKKPT